MEGSGKQSFLDRLKDATAVAATKAREGIEELQTKTELSRTYGELGRKTAELAESGAVSHPELKPLVDKITSLKAELAAAEAPATERTPPSEPPSGAG
jgi:hypothetical protein